MPAEGGQDRQGLTSVGVWAPPPGGFERVMRQSPWQRDRAAYSAHQLRLTRVTIVVTLLASAVVIAVGDAAARGTATGVLGGLVGSLLVTSTHQKLQLLGLRPARRR